MTERNRLVRHPWRAAIIGIALLTVVNLGVVLLSASDTEPGGRRLPESVEGVFPGPGELVGLQETISADLRDDLTGVLVLDGVEVPEDQLDRVEPLGQVSFRPGGGKELRRLEPGTHTVVVLYWPQRTERPAEPSSYGWSFRAGA